MSGSSTFAQTLGNYPASIVRSGKNIIVSPTWAPSNTNYLLVTSSPEFRGVLSGIPNSGKIRIVDARPAGTYIIKVKAYNSIGNSTSKTFILTVSEPECTQGEMSSGAIISTGPNQNTAVIGDFNQDGHQDIAAAHEGGHNTLSIRFGDGTGGFYGTTELPVGSHPYNVAVADINGDGIHDLVTTNAGDNSITPILGVGNGTFIVKPVCDVGFGPISLVIADFDGDGKPDVITANLNANTASFRRGNGGGFFYGTTEINVGSNPYHIAPGDFNNDGKYDFATSNSGNSSVSIRLGNGNGAFSNAPDVSVGLNPVCIAVGDFNEDGKQDFSTTNYVINTSSIRLGDGSGNFYGTTEISAGVGAYFVAIGNFNGDVHDDLCIANYFDNTISMRFGDGTGGFVSGNDIPVGDYPTCVTIGELNQDNYNDLVVSNYSNGSVSVHLGVAGDPPPITIISNNPLCEGSELTLDGYGGSIYSWTGPNGFASINSRAVRSNMSLADSGLYVLTVIDSAKCEGTMTQGVVVWPNPNVAFFLVDDTVCSNSAPINLIGGYPQGGLYVGTGMFGNFFDPAFAGPGEYTINYVYWDVHDCASSDSQKIFVVVCETGTAEINNENHFNVYPNPSSGEVRMHPFTHDATASLYSTDGVLIKQWFLVVNDIPVLSIGEIANGLYLLKVQDKERMLVSKILKSTH